MHVTLARNSDKKNNAKRNNICINDKELVKQDILNKNTTPFNPNLYKVIGINGKIIPYIVLNSIILE